MDIEDASSLFFKGSFKKKKQPTKVFLKESTVCRAAMAAAHSTVKCDCLKETIPLSFKSCVWGTANNLWLDYLRVRRKKKTHHGSNKSETYWGARPCRAFKVSLRTSE